MNIVYKIEYKNISYTNTVLHCEAVFSSYYSPCNYFQNNSYNAEFIPCVASWRYGGKHNFNKLPFAPCSREYLATDLSQLVPPAFGEVSWPSGPQHPRCQGGLVRLQSPRRTYQPSRPTRLTRLLFVQITKLRNFDTIQHYTIFN